jgi:hypothetical protein
MGQQSRLRAARREALERHKVAAARQRYEQDRARPEIKAVHAASLADDELQARWQADYPAQRERLKAAGWVQRKEAYAGAGMWDHRSGHRVIHDIGRYDDGNLWGHTSVSRRDGKLPDWYALNGAHRLLYPDLKGMQLAVPEGEHVNIAEVAHMWTCLTGDVLPDFGRFGTI